MLPQSEYEQNLTPGDILRMERGKPFTFHAFQRRQIKLMEQGYRIAPVGGAGEDIEPCAVCGSKHLICFELIRSVKDSHLFDICASCWHVWEEIAVYVEPLAPAPVDERAAFLSRISPGQPKPRNRADGEYTAQCPGCGHGDHQIKIGRMPSGSQRYKCKLCGKKYAPKENV